jgi:hypothetical protein
LALTKLASRGLGEGAFHAFFGPSRLAKKSSKNQQYPIDSHPWFPYFLAVIGP